MGVARSSLGSSTSPTINGFRVNGLGPAGLKWLVADGAAVNMRPDFSFSSAGLPRATSAAGLVEAPAHDFSLFWDGLRPRDDKGSKGAAR